MAGAVTSKLEGVAVLDRKLRNLGSALSVPILRSAVRAGIKPALDRAGQLIPIGREAHRTYRGRLVAPGFSKRSLRIITKVSPDKRTVSAALGVRREAFYAILFTELGTARMEARPWLRPAFRQTREQQQTLMAAKLKERIDKVATQ